MPKIKLVAGDIVKILQGPQAGTITIVARKEDGRKEADAKFPGFSWLLAEFVPAFRGGNYGYRYLRVKPEHHTTEYFEKVGKVKKGIAAV